MTFTVTLSAPSATIVTVRYDTTDGSATIGGGDYVPVPPTILVFQPGETVKTFSVQLVGDTKPESDEGFFASLRNPTGAAFDAGGVGTTALGRIIDDDTAPRISMNNVSITEGNSGTTNAVFTVQRSGNLLGQPLRLNYSTSDGTAGRGSDYVPTIGTLAFAAGQTNQTITVPIIGDTLVEPDETFFVNLGSVSIPNLLQGKGTIVNDDSSVANMPLLSISNASVMEGNSGLTVAAFPVSLSAVSAQPITVNWTTADGTATAPSDYMAASGILTFAPGQTSLTIPVQVVGDTLAEPDETFFVNLSNPVNTTISAGQSAGTIRNDDASIDTPPTLSNIPDQSITDGTPNVSILFTIGDAETPVTALTLIGSSSNPALLPGANIVFNGDDANRTVILTPVAGQTGSATITLTVSDGSASASDSFILTINPKPYVPLTLFPIPDTTITLGTPFASVSVGVTGGTGQLIIPSLTVHSSDSTLLPNANIVVTVAPLNGPPSQIILMPVPGQTGSSTITVTVSDGMVSASSSFLFSVNRPANVPVISMSDVFVLEGNRGTTPAVFTVRLSAISAQPITVNWTTADGTATASSDYLATGGTLTIAPGQSSLTISIQVIGDTLAEPDETFFVNLSTPVNAMISAGQGVGTIVNDETLTISPISDQTIAVNTTTAPIPFTVANAIANAANLLFSARSSNPTLVPNENIQFGGSGTNRAVVIVPAPDQSGDAIITINAFDGAATASVSFALRVNDANTPPTISSIPNQTTEPCRPTGQIAFTISDVETPAELLRLKATSSNQSLVLDQNILFSGSGSNRAISILTSTGQGGTSLITVEVADNEGGSVSTQFFVIVGGLGAVFPNDINGDGSADILFQNSDGSVGVWFMNGGPELLSASFFNPNNVGDTGWQIVGSGVLDVSQSCGSTDLLFQHTDGTLAVWHMNGTELISSALLNPSQPGPGWTVVGTGDLNRDGRKDILFQQTDGTLGVWYMDGVNLIEGRLINPSNPGDPRWRVVGTADLGQKGSTDLIFQHADGTLGAWYMDGINLVQGVLFNPSTPGGDWRVAGTVDLNQDGKTDLLFQHSDGSVGVWFMDQLTLISGQMLNPSHPGDGWRIVGPR
jgi:hypothetical protein